MKDYYQILGVARDATYEDIKGAYRRLALQYHPDRSADPGAHDRFVAINEAYEVLRDDRKRVAYDRALDRQAAFGGPGEMPFGRRSFDDWSDEARRRADAYADMSFAEFEEAMRRAFAEMQRAQGGQQVHVIQLGCARYFWLILGAIVIVVGFTMLRRSLLLGLGALMVGALMFRRGLVSR